MQKVSKQEKTKQNKAIKSDVATMKEKLFNNNHVYTYNILGKTEWKCLQNISWGEVILIAHIFTIENTVEKQFKLFRFNQLYVFITL